MLSLAGVRKAKVLVKLETVIKNQSRSFVWDQIQNDYWRLSRKQLNYEFMDNLIQEGRTTLYTLERDGNRILLTKYIKLYLNNENIQDCLEV